MDAGTIRGAGTLILLLSFVVLCFWAWSPTQRRRFEEAERIPFLDDDMTPELKAGRPEQKAGRPEQMTGRPEQRAGRPEQMTGRPEQRAGKPELTAGRALR